MQNFLRMSNKAKKKLKHTRKNDKVQQESVVLSLAKIPHILILLAYIFFVTFTPNWMALDTNAPKFMSLAVLNLVSFIYLISTKEFKVGTGSMLRFFTTYSGLAYTGFLVMSLLSFTQVINTNEFILNFGKVFSVFSATYIISAILMQDMRLVRLVAFVVTGILLFDALSVFYYIGEFIDGNIDRITDIKTVYSNKNILASALFAKIPFALWILVYEKGWLKRMGWLGLFLGVLATFFMVARAFYVGLIIVTAIFIGYSVVNYFRSKGREHLYLLGSYLAAIVLALAIFSFVQQNMYPKKSGRHTSGIGAQIGSIKAEDGSTKIRLTAWKYSLEMIKENPVLGVGTGNWKINVLKYENQEKPGFIYLYKAHNDFLENTVETGILGGLFYLGIFLMTAWAFLMAYFNRKQLEALYKYLFLAASGLLFFSFDALFNFPHDRPEMMILFALYVSVSISATYYLNRFRNESQINERKEEEDGNVALSQSEAILAGGSSESITHEGLKSKPWLMYIISPVIIVIMFFYAWIFYINFQSSKLQRVIYQEILSGTLRSKSDKFVGQFPFIPDVSIWGEPIPALVARYLINDGKHEEAIEELRPYDKNPWDARREFFMATAFSSLKQNDSALHYAHLAYQLKPNYFRNLHIMLKVLEEEKNYDEVSEYIDKFLETNKRELNGWIFSTGFYSRIGDLDKAYDQILEAEYYFPNDSLINQQRRYLYHHKYIVPNRQLFARIMNHFNAKRYTEAIPLLDEYIGMVKQDANAYRVRAFSYYHTNAYDECINDINSYFDLQGLDSSLLNLRGVCLRAKGELESACKDFRQAMHMGLENAKTNYQRFCENTR